MTPRAKQCMAAIVAALVAAATASAAPPITLLETAIETTAGAVTMDAAAGGSLIVRPCPSCPMTSLPIEAATRFVLSHRDVSASQMREAMLRYPRFPLLIVRANGSGRLLRVELNVPEASGAPR
ncbi:MAG: hypothetical protein R3E77_07545 [Steroidobacteraceae bacterium]